MHIHHLQEEAAETLILHHLEEEEEDLQQAEIRRTLHPQDEAAEIPIHLHPALVAALAMTAHHLALAPMQLLPTTPWTPCSAS